MLPEILKEMPVPAEMVIEPGDLVEVCRFLKQERQFNRLSGVTAVDRYPAEPRFEMVYLLHSLPLNQRMRLKCMVGEPYEIESVCEVWRSANWYEREVFDLFGVTFKNHPDLRRIMMPDEFQGYPLRKDFPVHGFKYSYQDE
jgi:NADH-quinone oxidoreductase subunit C